MKSPGLPTRQFDDPSIDNDSHSNYHLDRIKFSLLLSFQIPAYLLSLLIFFFFIKNSRVLAIAHYPAILILLIVNFVQLTVTLPISVLFYSRGHVTPRSPIFCQWWIFIEFSLYSISEYLMATISVQRHMLVFNGHLLRISWIRYVFHHAPLFLAIFYPTLFYFCAILLYPCDGSQYDYHRNLCGFVPCYLLYDGVLGGLDWTFNNGVPMIINAIANGLLIFRVVYQKRQQNRTLTWKQQRRLTVQLTWISSLYLIAWTPCILVGLAQSFGFRTFLVDVQNDYFLDLVYLVCLFLPWICLGLLPELFPWIKGMCPRRFARNAVSAVGQLVFSTATHPVANQGLTSWYHGDVDFSCVKSLSNTYILVSNFHVNRHEEVLYNTNTETQKETFWEIDQGNKKEEDRIKVYTERIEIGN